MRIGNIELQHEDLATHIRIMGKSGMGKSTLLYDLITQLILEDAGLCLLDPHGELYLQVISFLSYIDYRTKDVFLFDTTETEITSTVNPFQADANIETKAKILTDLTLQVWGKDTDAVRTEKILYILYVALLEQNRPLEQLFSLLRKGAVDHTAIRSRFAREEWERLNSRSAAQFEEFVSSVRTRLMPLAHSGLLELTHPSKAIDFRKLLDGQILLANLSRGRLGQDECKTLSAFIVAEIWSRAFSRATKHPPFYLIIDEFAMLANREIASVLTQAQKFGLHLIFLDQPNNPLPSYMQGPIDNVSLFVEFLRKGLVRVNGWEAGVKDSWLKKEPIPYSSFDDLVNFRRKVAIPASNAAIPPAPEEIGDSEKPIMKTAKANEPKANEPRGKGSNAHKVMQTTILNSASGWNAELEKAIPGGNVDVSLERDGTKIAVEISVGNAVAYEIQNILKALEAGYHHAVVVTTQQSKIQKLTKEGITALDYRGLGKFLRTFERKKDWLTPAEFAEERGFDVVTVRRWCQKGELPAQKHGPREWRISREEAQAWKGPVVVPKIKIKPFVLKKAKRKKNDPGGFREIMGLE